MAQILEERPEDPMSDENRSVNDTQQTSTTKQRNLRVFLSIFVRFFHYMFFFEKFENVMRRSRYHKEREKIIHKWNQI
jgi:hypothetical protein